MSSFTHIDDKGHVRMVDVTAKKTTARVAVAGGTVHVKPETFNMIRDHKVKKGNVLETARIAGNFHKKKQLIQFFKNFSNPPALERFIQYISKGFYLILKKYVCQ